MMVLSGLHEPRIRGAGDESKWGIGLLSWRRTVQAAATIYPLLAVDCYIFQRDSALAHRSSATIELICRESLDFIAPHLWPLNSPDLNSVDYRTWRGAGLLCSVPHCTVFIWVTVSVVCCTASSPGICFFTRGAILLVIELAPPSEEEDELKRLIIDSWSSIQQAIIDQAINQWRVRLKECILETGGHFEHLL